MNTTRTPLPKVTAIQLLTVIIVRSAGQQFYRTDDNAYELWQDEPLMRIRRWSDKNIYVTYDGDVNDF